MKTYRAINIYTHEEAVFTVEGEGPESIYVRADGDRWRAKDFFSCWRTEGGEDYRHALRRKRQKAEYESATAAPTQSEVTEA